MGAGKGLRRRVKANMGDLVAERIRKGQSIPNPSVVDGIGKVWHRNGFSHREDGPAYEGEDGTRSWHLDGLRHRADGPAIVWADGKVEYWIDGKQATRNQIVEIKSVQRLAELRADPPSKI